MARRERITDLAPTQMTLGLYFVARNRSDFSAMSDKRLDCLLEKRKVPVVRGPGGRHYMIDRHHFCRALFECGVDHVRIDPVVDARHLDIDEFSHFMEKSGLVHAYDAAGERHGFDDLPHDIAGLVDDPYRTLAGLLREKGGYRKEKRPFAEFLWADFLRRRIASDLLTGDFSEALAEAVRLARSRDPKHLPGWK